MKQDIIANKVFLLGLVFTFFVGLLHRVIPLLTMDESIFWRFPTEDGYLMLTMARNIALGLGMSTAEGTIPTNGTQPLATLIYSLAFLFNSGDKLTGVYIVSWFQVVIAILTSINIYIIVKNIFNQSIFYSCLGAVVWFSVPNSLRHTTNALETGLYVYFISLSVVVYFRYVYNKNDLSIKTLFFCICLGVVLGLTFLARIDAFLLIFAICATHLLRSKEIVYKSLMQSCVFGLVSVIIASPWLIYNKMNFGSIMPISGTAQSASSNFASNLSHAPSALAEHFLLITLIPNSLYDKYLVIIVTTVLCFMFSFYWCFEALKANSKSRNFFLIGFVFMVLLFAWYSLFFGAQHFLSRYLFPVTIFTIIVWVYVFIGMERYFKFKGIMLFFVFLFVLAFNVREYIRNSEHMHYQVVEWTHENVPEDVWVGAVQTGTLGFFHDKTINLDGKVNPRALEARLDGGRVPEYILETDIKYLIDWYGISTWIDRPIFSDNFDLIVADKDENLAVLKRK